jgi:hypothetical protein
VLIHRLSTQERRLHVAGATQGHEHLRHLLPHLQRRQGEIVVLDFTGIESATASYLKATILWLIQCAVLPPSPGGRSSLYERGPYDLRPLDIYPVVAQLGEDVREELDAVLPGYRLPCLEAVRHSEHQISQGVLHGPLDAALADALDVLTASRGGTATFLCERSGGAISVTGWNNRLAELHSLRLATRRKEGRQWVYEPIIAEVSRG